MSFTITFFFLLNLGLDEQLIQLSIVNVIIESETITKY